jgi:hypothetical protein
MPRDGSGVYSLPAGNPVVTNTIIASAWANSTLGDIAAQLNNVYTRDGLLGPTGPFKLQDGTVNAPGLAFNSEPGLGWYRSGTSNIRMTAQGLQTFDFGMQVAANTYVALNPRVVGGSGIYLSTDPAGSSNNRSLGFVVDQTQHVIYEALSGTATAKPLFLNFPAGTNLATNSFAVNAPFGAWAQVVLNKYNGTSNLASMICGKTNNVNRWFMMMGDGANESGGNNGSDFTISRFADNGEWMSDPIRISRSSGNTALSYVVQTTIIVGGASNVEMAITPAGNYISGFPAWPITNGGYISIRGSASGNYSAGAISCYSGSGNTGCYLPDAANSWVSSSDERLKNIDSEITNGLEAVLAMRPIRFRYKTDDVDGRMRVALTAQSVLTHVPEAVYEAPILEGPERQASAVSYLNLALTDVIPHLVSALHTLNERITQLENA